MGRERSPNRKLAYELYKERNGQISSKEIAKILDEKISNINTWRVRDKWKRSLNKVGAPYNNQNALDNKGGHGAPMENQNARKDGWYSKYYPVEARNLIKEAEEAGGSPLEILWAQIMTQWVAIIRAQKIMFVKDKNDKTKELKKLKSERKLISKNSKDTVETYREEEYEIQQAWDKYATFLNAQSTAMARLTSMLKRYDEMLHNNWDTVTEEQKLRVEKLKAQIANPELEYRKEIDKKKLELERERFEHNKKINESKVW